MDEFSRHIKDNLERRPEPAFEASAWNDLNWKLNTHHRKHEKKHSWWWLLALLLLLSMGLNSWLLLSDKEGQTREVVLQQLDTLVQTRLVVKRDTIYQTRTVYKTVIEYLPTTSAFPASTTLASASLYPKRTNTLMNNFGLTRPNAFQLRTTAIPSNAPALHKPPPSIVLSQLNQSIPKKPKAFTSFDPLESLPFSLLTIDPSNALDVENFPIITNKGKQSPSMLTALKPKGFQLGLQTGWSIPFHSKLATIDGNLLDLQATIPFSEQLSIWLSASILKLQYTVDRMDENLGIPILTPPSDDFVFSQVEAPQLSMQYAVGMQYIINPRQKWRSYIGFGMATTTLLPYELNYEFENPILGIDAVLQQDAIITQEFDRYYLLQLGLKHRLFKRMDWQIQASYRRNWDESAINRPNLLLIKTGLNYRF